MDQGTARAGMATARAVPPVRLSLARKPTGPARAPLGHILQQMGALAPQDLLRALELQARQAGLLGDILLSRGMITEAALTEALSRQHDARFITEADPPPDPALMDAYGLRRCLDTQCLPWARAGAVTVVATARPDRFARHRAALEAVFGPVVMVLIGADALQARVLAARRSRLRLWAETCVAPAESCRDLLARGFGRVLGAALAGLALAAVAAPHAMLTALTLLATVALALATALKLAAAFASITRPAQPAAVGRAQSIVVQRRPVVSIMVPLYREPAVVPRLLNRLARLTWPRDLLDILLVVEENDHATRDALARHALPGWVRVIPVPDAQLRTKPRALNYAMLFARGTVVGVYDAEDAPDPDQIHRVVACFHRGPATLACVQGVLDFYNPRTNWLARCFTIEYASWFRVILPGMQRLGLAVPLGGTTLFFRRDILEQLGGWDAHNVTEDADLGIRLARHGYYTQLLDTVTQEEANCHVLPWIKQRSRWLKGYAVTWLVNMRAPRAMWRQLGPWRFAGVQVLFLGTLVQFLLAPLLWSFWLMLLGTGHPLQTMLPDGVLPTFAALFLLAEATTVTVGALALRARHHAGLWQWLPALHLYFPLAVVAVYKALWELVRTPFYWDKTAHGHYGAALDAVVVGGHG